MTKDELKQVIETSIEQKLLELLGDPDEGFQLKTSVRERLLRQQKSVAKGEPGKSFDGVVNRLT